MECPHNSQKQTCVCVCVQTQAFGCDAAGVVRIHSPVIILQYVHDLQHSPHSTDGVVDGCRANKLCWKVCVQRELHLNNRNTHIHTRLQKVTAASGKNTKHWWLLSIVCLLFLNYIPRSLIKLLFLLDVYGSNTSGMAEQKIRWVFLGEAESQKVLWFVCEQQVRPD